MTRTRVIVSDVLTTLTGLGISALIPGMGVRAARERGKDRDKSLIVLSGWVVVHVNLKLGILIPERGLVGQQKL